MRLQRLDEISDAGLLTPVPRQETRENQPNPRQNKQALLYSLYLPSELTVVFVCPAVGIFGGRWTEPVAPCQDKTSITGRDFHNFEIYPPKLGPFSSLSSHISSPHHVFHHCRCCCCKAANNQSYEFGSLVVSQRLSPVLCETPRVSGLHRRARRHIADKNDHLHENLVDRYDDHLHPHPTDANGVAQRCRSATGNHGLRSHGWARKKPVYRGFLCAAEGVRSMGDHVWRLLWILRFLIREQLRGGGVYPRVGAPTHPPNIPR